MLNLCILRLNQKAICGWIFFFVAYFMPQRERTLCRELYSPFLRLPRNSGQKIMHFVLSKERVYIYMYMYIYSKKALFHFLQDNLFLLDHVLPPALDYFLSQENVNIFSFLLSAGP